MESTVKSLFDICARKVTGSKLIDLTEQYVLVGSIPEFVYEKIYNIVRYELNLPCSTCEDKDGNLPMWLMDNENSYSLTCPSCVRRNRWCETLILRK